MSFGKELIARFKPGENIPVYATNAGNINAGHFVTISGRNAKSAYVGAHTGAGSPASGVAERDALAGVTDHRGGTNLTRRGSIARVVAGAAVAIGDLIASDSTGRAITYVPPNTTAVGAAIATSPRVLGRALQAASAAGDIIDVDLY